MPFTDMSHGKRRFWVILGLLTANAVVVGGLTLDYLDFQGDAKREACKRTVDARQGTRTMWLYLVEQNPDNPEVPEFVAELNRRLPEYVCVDDVPTPVTPPDPD